ncbi:MAG: insulinase family protein [Spirochaetes bacterium]|nr:insulinase family protein [Spirochaetota bacterium]
MKKFLTVIILFSILIVSWDRTEAESLKQKQTNGSFLSSLPKIKKYKMKNDLDILYIKDELPVTVIYASISFGKMYEDSGNAGIAETLTTTISISGTDSFRGNTLYQKIESIGGTIRINAGLETIGIEIKVLSKYGDLAFNILADILKNPIFEDDGLSSAKRLVLSKIMRSMDEPDEIGVLKLREIIFCGSGYGASPSAKSIEGTNPDSLKQIWKRFATGRNISVAVSSSMDENSIVSLAEKELSGIERGNKETYSVDKDKVINSIKSSAGKIYLIPMELEQATIYTGTLAPAVKYDGNYALYAMNYILGGGSFNSRLMNDIRVKRGLAYSVFSLVKNRRNTGVFIGFVQTRNESVPEVLSLINSNITKMRSEPVDADELQWAKESIKNSYIFKFETIEDILGNYLDLEYNELSGDYYENYLTNINNVTVSKITDESKKLFNHGLVTVVVGNINLKKELSSLGEVVVLSDVK